MTSIDNGYGRRTDIFYGSTSEYAVDIVIGNLGFY